MSNGNKHKPKILIYDIETSPNIGYTWAMYEQNVIKIIKESELLSYAYKWYGEEKEVTCVKRPDFTCSTDKSLARSLWKLFNEADIVIAHNGDEFDQKKARARFAFHGFAPHRPFRTVDTKKVAKRYFKFNSNSLDNLGTFLKVGRKLKHTGFELWEDCMAGKPAAWKLMEKYNIQDVKLLERVYKKLKPWMDNHPRASLLYGEVNCPSCESRQVQRRGISFTNMGTRQRYQCQACGNWFQEAHSKKVGG